MKAVTYDRFGPPDVLRVKDVPEPSEPQDGARVAVHAAALNPKDVLIRKGRMRWLSGTGFPRVPGYDVAGTLIGAANGFPAGSPVYGMIQSNRGGGCAEVALLREGEFAAAPKELSMVEAASLPLAGLTALQALRDELGVSSGQTVLLNGASGGVGSLAIQIGKALGARVIAVCSGRNAEFVTGLGADEVLDYTQTAVEARRGLDHIFDIYGTLPWARAGGMLTPTGRYCSAIPRPKSVFHALLSRVGLHRARLVVVRSRRADLEWLATQVESGAVRPVVDRVVPLTRSHEGHQHLETRRARGKVVIQVRD